MIKRKCLSNFDDLLFVPYRRFSPQTNATANRNVREQRRVYVPTNRLKKGVPLPLGGSVGTCHRITKENISQPIGRFGSCHLGQPATCFESSSKRVTRPETTVEAADESGLNGLLHGPQGPDESTTPCTNKCWSPGMLQCRQLWQASTHIPQTDQWSIASQVELHWPEFMLNGVASIHADVLCWSILHVC